MSTEILEPYSVLIELFGIRIPKCKDYFEESYLLPNDLLIFLEFENKIRIFTYKILHLFFVEQQIFNLYFFETSR